MIRLLACLILASTVAFGATVVNEVVSAEPAHAACTPTKSRGGNTPSWTRSYKGSCAGLTQAQVMRWVVDGGSPIKFFNGPKKVTSYVESSAGSAHGHAFSYQ